MHNITVLMLSFSTAKDSKHSVYKSLQKSYFISFRNSVEIIRSLFTSGAIFGLSQLLNWSDFGQQKQTQMAPKFKYFIQNIVLA